VLTRTHYWDRHEPCWYVSKKNAPWFGKAGENSTIWDSPSPKFIMGGSDEAKFDHPTQKPVDLMRRPILNHTRRGELVYEPFMGSGTTLAAAELTERVCLGMELDPKYIDVIVQHWQTLAGKKATLDGDGRSFEEVAEERQGRAAGTDRCRAEIAAVEAQIRAGHADLEGLCLALSDWSRELRLIERELDLQARKPAVARAGRAREGASDATG
jgi:hypothetical protein